MKLNKSVTLPLSVLISTGVMLLACNPMDSENSTSMMWFKWFLLALALGVSQKIANVPIANPHSSNPVSFMGDSPNKNTSVDQASDKILDETDREENRQEKILDEVLNERPHNYDTFYCHS